MNETPFAPDRIIAALDAADVAYVIVGGLAVAAHGVVRAPRDLDLVPDPSATNLERLAAALRDLGAEHPIDGALTGDNLACRVSFKLRTVHDLRAMKLASGRPRELVDVAELDELHHRHAEEE